MKPKLLILSAIVLFSGLIRLIFLNSIPSAITNDELHFVLNSKSIYYGFTNIEGNANPFKLSEISSFLFAPIIGPLPNSLFYARLPNVLVLCFSVILVYLIVLKLTRNLSLALISALVFSLNPWSIYVSRTAFDAPVAIFFYLLTIYLLSLDKARYILLSCFTGILAFYSYIATKVIYFPIILFTSFYIWKFFQNKNGRYYFFAIIFSFIITINFILTLPNQLSGNRISEIQSPNAEVIKDQVNLERRQSLQVPFVREVLTNKYTVYFRVFVQKYQNSFSNDTLFLNGDKTATGSLWRQGYFYYIDALLILFGIIFLYLKYKKFLILLITLILLAPLPEAFRSSQIPSYVFHSSLQFPLISILSASGILLFWQIFRQKIIRVLLVAIYLLCFLNFFDLYFFKAPIYQPESFFFSHRVLSKFLAIESSHNQDIYVLSQEPEVLFRAHLFYTDYYQKDKYDYIKSIYSNTKDKDNLTLGRIHFINHQKYLPNSNNYTLIYDSIHFNFEGDDNTIYISNLSDVGNIFSIKGNLSCQNLVLSTYPNNIFLKDLYLEKLGEGDFCKKYINIK